MIVLTDVDTCCKIHLLPWAKDAAGLEADGRPDVLLADVGIVVLNDRMALHCVIFPEHRITALKKTVTRMSVASPPESFKSSYLDLVLQAICLRG